MKLAILPILLSLTLPLSCARTSSDGDGDGDCDSSADCDDSIDCTFDSCESGSCAHQAVDELCEEGEVCDPSIGCTTGGCSTDEDCDDGHDCTIDSCAVGGVCNNQPVDALCEGGLVCRIDEGCVDAGCASDDDCDDAIICTHDICGEDGACTHVPDNTLCEEGEACREGIGCNNFDCELDEDCDDGNFCNGSESCHPEFGCLPAEEPEDCDDNDECTIDSCNTETDQCEYVINTEIEGCDTFDPERHLSGCFDVEPYPAQSCALGAVNYRVEEVCFELVGSVLTVTTGPLDPMELAQVPAPTDENFSAYFEISGACTETYTLSGTFSGSSRFSGTWTSVFTPDYGGACFSCGNRTFAITAVRNSGP